MKKTSVIENAQWVVDLFDQANTGQTIVNLGSRGKILADAVDDLRESLRVAGYPSILPYKGGNTKPQSREKAFGCKQTEI